MTTHRTTSSDLLVPALVRTGPAPVPTTKLTDALTERLVFARVQRAGIVSFVTSGGFASLPLTDLRLVDSAQGRAQIAKARALWPIPLEDCGRIWTKAQGATDDLAEQMKMVFTRETAESIRLWVKNLGPLVPVGSYSVIMVPAGIVLPPKRTRKRK